MATNGKQVVTATLEATIVRADGRQEPQGVIARYDGRWWARALHSAQEAIRKAFS